MADKPAYRDRYPCASCGTGSLDCDALALHSLKCCKDCDGHPERYRLGSGAYTQEEVADMRKRHTAKREGQ